MYLSDVTTQTIPKFKWLILQKETQFQSTSIKPSFFRFVARKSFMSFELNGLSQPTNNGITMTVMLKYSGNGVCIGKKSEISLSCHGLILNKKYWLRIQSDTDQAGKILRTSNKCLFQKI